MTNTHWEGIGLVMRRHAADAPDALAAYAGAIAALADEIWHEHYTPIIGAAQVDYMVAKYQSAQRIYTDIAENGFVYYTAEDPATGRMVAYCGIVPAEGYLLLSKLYVHLEYRGKGVARRFLDEAAGQCRNAYGMDTIRLTVNKYNENSIAAYRKMGFVTIDSVKTDIGEGFFMDDYVMELAL
ncbi:MAG: GNAT family N-acetyltransferase [Clostridiales bacterium]|nr:GNAT family N-acetyltransferase [Clostridiales bacterium]